jgi:hypothetical protein
MEKVETYVRMANSDYYQKIMLDPTKIKEPSILNEEVFFKIDDCTVAMKREEYDLITSELFLYLQKNYPLK